MIHYAILALTVAALGYEFVRKGPPRPLLSVIGAAAFAFAMLVSLLTWDLRGDRWHLWARVATAAVALILAGLLIARRRRIG